MHGLISGMRSEASLKQILFIAVLFFSTANGEASTKLKESWKNPTYLGSPSRRSCAWNG